VVATVVAVVVVLATEEEEADLDPDPDLVAEDLGPGPKRDADRRRWKRANVALAPAPDLLSVLPHDLGLDR